MDCSCKCKTVHDELVPPQLSDAQNSEDVETIDDLIVSLRSGAVWVSILYYV